MVKVSKIARLVGQDEPAAGGAHGRQQHAGVDLGVVAAAHLRAAGGIMEGQLQTIRI